MTAASRGTLSSYEIIYSTFCDMEFGRCNHGSFSLILTLAFNGSEKPLDLFSVTVIAISIIF